MKSIFFQKLLFQIRSNLNNSFSHHYPTALNNDNQAVVVSLSRKNVRKFFPWIILGTFSNLFFLKKKFFLTFFAVDEDDEQVEDKSRNNEDIVNNRRLEEFENESKAASVVNIDNNYRSAVVRNVATDDSNHSELENAANVNYHNNPNEAEENWETFGDTENVVEVPSSYVSDMKHKLRMIRQLDKFRVRGDVKEDTFIDWDELWKQPGMEEHIRTVYGKNGLPFTTFSPEGPAIELLRHPLEHPTEMKEVQLWYRYIVTPAIWLSGAVALCACLLGHVVKGAMLASSCALLYWWRRRDYEEINFFNERRMSLGISHVAEAAMEAKLLKSTTPAGVRLQLLKPREKEDGKYRLRRTYLMTGKFADQGGVPLRGRLDAIINRLAGTYRLETLIFYPDKTMDFPHNCYLLFHAKKENIVDVGI